MRTLSFVTALLLLAGPALAQGGFLGVAIAEPGVDDGGPGALIQDVQPRSAGFFLGLRGDDLVVAFDGQPVPSAASFSRMVGARLPGEVVDLTVLRDHEEVVLSGVLGRRPGAAAPPEGLPGLPLQAPRGLQRLPSPLDADGFDAEMERLMREVDAMQRELQQGFPQLDLSLPALPEFRIDLGAQPGVETHVRLRYPADTAEEERARLRSEAIEKYGEGVEVEFEGDGTMVFIERRSSSATAPLRPQPRPAPRGNGDVEEL